MSRHRAFIAGVVWGFSILGSLGSGTAEGQIQALPPTGPPVDPDSAWLANQTVPYDTEQPSASRETAPNGPTLDMGVRPGLPGPLDDYWGWQILPEGLLYRAYLASGRESRFASHWIHERDHGWLWDAALGGHVGLLRYGSRDPCWPEGWQWDIEGAAFPRLTLDDARDVVSVDFRFGIPLTFRRGPVETKFAYYHISSHLGDEYMVTHATLDRLNYVRDALVAGIALRPNEDVRLYAEAGWAFNTDGGSEPWEFQFGIDYSPARPSGFLGTPFFAINARLREEVDFGGNMTVQTGLQWRGHTGRLVRAGMHYFNGYTDQYEFFTEHEEQIGFGLWYDF